MTTKKQATKAVWSDPDDAPELTAKFFETADFNPIEKTKSLAVNAPNNASRDAIAEANQIVKTHRVS